MYTNDFEYYRAESVDAAIELLIDHDGAELVAGSHGLLPRMRTGEETPPVLVDISAVDEISGIENSSDELSVGALATHAEIASSETVRKHASALSVAASNVGDRQVRNGGTIGGNLAHGDARTDLPASVLALGGSLSARGPDGERLIAADDLFCGHFETSVDNHEVLTELLIPIDDNVSSAYIKHRNPRSGYPLVGVAVGVRTADDSIEEARVAATGSMSRPMRLQSVEDELEGAVPEEETVVTAANQAGETIDETDLRPDVQTSPAYCNHLLSVYTERALRRALDVSES
ncbi:FAD binding domain-containing protein [Halegenticoccus tardaugens]|uniref:FAD binding domain-containing protein n=1 Tax=Halegenticoccus tardaugens TaxID=2071624 RepID=UPI00100A8F22|nr:xanthine dehydrogenase family protein subunit M [Halegenticoccus tardaugens]